MDITLKANLAGADMKIERVEEGDGELRKGEILLLLPEAIGIGLSKYNLILYFDDLEYKQFIKGIYIYSKINIAYKIKHGGVIDEG